ncbi:MAG: imidazoleglycerol-phosphate dehydratase HisB [Methanomicrobiales archaeon]|nr:imidazoleglycerol-phosphate dehydratase HisB [Methanomicrobiales archaeon]
MRTGRYRRTTKETDISVSIDLDGEKGVSVATNMPFFDHMLTAMGRHGAIGLEVQAEGDLAIDSHHTVEDTGIVLGTALKEAIGDGRGIRRFAHTAVPMDEAIATITLDCGGRGYLVWEDAFSDMPLGGAIPGNLIEHFFYSLCTHAGITAHISVRGANDHHACEAAFKAFGVALRSATARDEKRNDIPSTKGVL